MPNFTPDYLYDSNKQRSVSRGISSGIGSAIRPNDQTVKNLLAFSRALEVHGSKEKGVEVVLNWFPESTILKRYAKVYRFFYFVSLMNVLIRLLLNALLVFALSWALPGVDVSSFWTALVVAVILGFLNIFIKPILILITIPVTLLTLGLFLLVINALVILMADWIVDGFNVHNFWWALLFSLILSVMNSAFEQSAKGNGEDVDRY